MTLIWQFNPIQPKSFVLRTQDDKRGSTKLIHLWFNFNPAEIPRFARNDTISISVSICGKKRLLPKIYTLAHMLF